MANILHRHTHTHTIIIIRIREAPVWRWFYVWDRWNLEGSADNITYTRTHMCRGVVFVCVQGRRRQRCRGGVNLCASCRFKVNRRRRRRHRRVTAPVVFLVRHLVVGQTHTYSYTPSCRIHITCTRYIRIIVYVVLFERPWAAAAAAAARGQSHNRKHPRPGDYFPR